MKSVSGFRRSFWQLSVVSLTLGLGRPAQAERQHTVREGQSLISIAHGYQVSVSSLAAANDRQADAPLRVGEVLSVPERGVVYLGTGQSLWTVARANDCTVEELARINGLTVDTRLRPGTKLQLPRGGPAQAKSATPELGAKSTSTKGAASAKGGAAGSARATNASSSVRSGAVTLYRIATQERLKVTLTDQVGRVRPQALARRARFLRPRNSTKKMRPEARILALLAETAGHFSGRTIQVVSGYRVAGGYTSNESRHTRGAAMDIRIEGVAHRALCDYLRHFKNVGVGLYPNSGFVHFDVRDKNAYWVDLSSPGRKPSYLDREQRDHFDGKNKDEGLVELARSVEAAVDQDPHGEPEEGAPQAADE